MISIDRSRRDENGNAIQPNQTWFDNATVKTTQAVADGETHEVDDHYKHVQVTAALKKLSYDKCAYCECNLLNTEWDVEHYRPKGRVAESNNHPGYYWLAYTWTNLLPSCKFCNQRRRDPPRWGDMRFAVTAGKLDQFPLEDEATRVMTPADNERLAQETTLILNPCDEDPFPHIGFMFDGGVFAIADSLKGQTTIDVCHLTRRDLKTLRRDIIESVTELLELIESANQVGETALALQLTTYLNTKHLAPSAVFSATARYVVAHPAQFGI